VLQFSLKLEQQNPVEEPVQRAAPFAPAQTQVRAGAVLPGSGCAEHQATGAVPPPTGITRSTRHHLTERREDKTAPACLQIKGILLKDFFNTHAWLRQLAAGGRPAT
jgi:hypothetical protein